MSYNQKHSLIVEDITKTYFMKKIIPVLVILAFVSCSSSTSMSSDFDYKKIEQISDSIQIKDISVKNLFKYQILAHQSRDFGSAMIERNVYKPHQKLWDENKQDLINKTNNRHQSEQID